MPIIPSASNNKTADYEVPNEAADLGARAVVSGRLQIAVPPTAWPMHSTIYAQDTGAFWKIVEDPIGTPVAQFLGGPGAAPLRGLLFVDSAAPAGGNGSILLPFNTVQAALNAALPQTTILVAAGTYLENLVMPNTEGIHLEGVGRGQTILRNVGDAHTFDWTRSGVVPAVRRFTMSNLTVVNDAATASNACLNLDANGEDPVPAPAVNNFGRDGLVFENVECIRQVTPTGIAVFLRRATLVLLSNCLWRGEIGIAGTTVTQNVSRVNAFSSVFTNLDQQWIRSNPQPFGGRNAFSMFAGSAVSPFEDNTPALQGGVILRGHPIFVADSTCLLSGSTGVPALQGIGLSTIGNIGFGPASAPIIGVAATIGTGTATPGSGVVTLPLPAYGAGIPAPSVDLSRAQFLVVPAAAGSFTVTGATPSVGPHFVSVTDTRMVYLTALGAPVANAVAVGSAVAGINNPVILDAREALYSAQTIFNVAAGSALDRTTWVQTVAAFPVGAAPVAITPPYPSANYTVTAETSNPVSVAVTAKTVANVTLNASGAAAGTITITRV